jgi:amidase
MKATCLISMTGCPSLAVPAGFDERGRAMGIQIVAPIHREMDCLRLAHAYERAANWNIQIPPLLRA